MKEKEEKYIRKITITGTLVDAYKLYKNTRKKSVIDYKTYMEICHLFNKTVSNKIITESMAFRIPYGLGNMRIKSVKNSIRIKDGVIQTGGLQVDWKKTKEMYMKLYGTNDWDKLKEFPDKKVVLHTNEHSNGYRMKWLWSRRDSCAFTNKTMYSFKSVKGCLTKDGYHTGRRGLAAWINNEERTNEYYL